MFSVRIVTADYYMASPLRGLDICQSPLTQAPVKKVPVVRVFGATPAGKRARGAGGGREPAGRPGCPPRRAHARARRRRASPRSGAAAPSPPPSPFPPCVTRGATMWIRGSAAPPLPQPPGQAAGAWCLHCARRRSAGPTRRAAAGGVRAANPGGRARWPAAPRPAGTGSRGPRSEGGLWWDLELPQGPPECPSPEAALGGAGKCQLRAAASPRRSPRPSLPETRSAGEWRPGPESPSPRRDWLCGSAGRVCRS